MDTLELIKFYGLSVRQLPKFVHHTYGMMHHIDGNTILKSETERIVSETFIRDFIIEE